MSYRFCPPGAPEYTKLQFLSLSPPLVWGPLLTLSLSLQCSNCDASSARCWCVDCNEALCDACVSAHRRVSVTRSHQILNQPAAGQIIICWSHQTVIVHVYEERLFYRAHSVKFMRLSVDVFVIDSLSFDDLEQLDPRPPTLPFVIVNRSSQSASSFI